MARPTKPVRTPSEFIAAAVRRVQSSLMPDCALSLSCGGATATVTRAASQTKGEPDLSGDYPAENLRVLALVSEFPSISKGDLATVKTAELGSVESARLVTSVRADPALASLYVGLSSPLDRYAASVSGVRGSRPIHFPVGILAVDNGLASDVTDGFAPTTVHAWSLAIAFDDWPELDPPNIGDEFRFTKNGEDVRVKVSRCDTRDRHFILNARSR